MPSYRFGVDHKCSDEGVVRDTLLECGFVLDADDDYLYKKKVRDWKLLKMKIQSDYSIEAEMHWIGDTTTETYFDYLVHCGLYIGRFMERLDHNMREHDAVSDRDFGDAGLPSADDESDQNDDEDDDG